MISHQPLKYAAPYMQIPCNNKPQKVRVRRPNFVNSGIERNAAGTSINAEMK